jgi:uncharacterized membrane protein
LVMSKSEELTRFLEYVRSRMRLARSTGLNLILITISAAVLLWTSSFGWLEIMAAVAGGLVLSLLSAFAWVRISRTYYERLAQAYNIVRSNNLLPPT